MRSQRLEDTDARRRDAGDPEDGHSLRQVNRARLVTQPFAGHVKQLGRYRAEVVAQLSPQLRLPT
ncbi:MAG TPA: hypothetical protein VEL02_06625 [Jatrophihabitantaceae bacterium]|nr:hypothetical protein [Jatrophihabitantaceae bacterium]